MNIKDIVQKRETMNKTLEEITKFRRTTKAYDPNRKVSDADWKRIVEFMHHAPHSMNFQTIRVIAVDNGTELHKELTTPNMVANNARLFEDLPKAVFFISSSKGKFDNTNPDFREGVKYSAAQKNKPVSEVTEADIDKFAPGVMKFANVMGFDDFGTWSKRQAYIPLAYMEIAAADLGLDTTPMEGMVPNNVKELFIKHNLMTEAEDVVLIQGLGYRKDETVFNKSERKPLDWFLTEVK